MFTSNNFEIKSASEYKNSHRDTFLKKIIKFIRPLRYSLNQNRFKKKRGKYQFIYIRLRKKYKNLKTEVSYYSQNTSNLSV